MTIDDTTIDRFEDEYRWLSNFWTGGDCKPSVEHQYQARKAITVENAIYVMAADKPGEAKRRGRSIQCRDDWDDVKLDVMYELLVMKFRASYLAQKLIDTGNALLIEGNTWGDTYWGVYRGKGTNYLGQLLMLVRSELRA